MIPQNNQTVAGATGTIEDRKERARFFLNKSKNDLGNAIVFNENINWTPREKKVFEELTPLVKTISEKIELLINKIPMQDKEMEEIKQQLVEKPVANVKVDFADNAEFSVIQNDTGAILVTGNKEVIKGVLNGLYIARQATAEKIE